MVESYWAESRAAVRQDVRISIEIEYIYNFEHEYIHILQIRMFRDGFPQTVPFPNWSGTRDAMCAMTSMMAGPDVLVCRHLVVD